MNTKKINTNPRKYAESLTLRELNTLLHDLDYAYHDQNDSPVKDEAYDIMVDVYNERSSRPYAKIGHVSTHKARQVKLPVRMGSLDKVKPGSNALSKLLKKGGPYVVSDKEDGISLALVYKNHKLVQALQRGDGVTGTDSSGVVKALTVVQEVPEKDFIVRVEFTMLHSIFNQHFDKESGGSFSNARNGAGGLLNRNKPTKDVSRVLCIAHEILKGKGAGQSPSRQFAILKKMGFDVVPHKRYDSLDEAKLFSILEKRRAKATRAIDGIVVAYDKPYSRSSSKNPDNMFAFKVNTLGDVVKVKNVEWNVSRHGKLVPRVEIEPTKIGDVTVRYFTGHNAHFINNGYISGLKKAPYQPRPINKGAEIRVVRSGDVIPYITEVVKGARAASRPDVDFTSDGVDFYAVDKLEEQEVKTITYFLSALKVEGIKSSTVKKLMANGFTDIKTIVNATAKDFDGIAGFGRVSAIKLEREIKKALKEQATLPKLAAASGLFGNTFGETRLALIFDRMPDIMKMKISDIRENARDIPGVKTLGPVFVEAWPKFKQFLRATGIKPIKQKRIAVTSTKAKGLNVLFTSVRDEEVKNWIIANGGTIAPSVKSANLLIVKSDDATNKKVDEARSKNIPILTLAAFRLKYKI